MACEPSDSVLAALLQMNDDLLAAVSSWNTTASRLAIQQSRSAAQPTASGTSQGSASSHVVSTTPELSDSSTSSNSDLAPTTVSSGGLFWSSTTAARPTQLPYSPAQQLPQQLPPQQGLQPQNRGVSQLHSNGSFLDDLAGLQPQYPHQSVTRPHDEDASWQVHEAGAGLPSALPPGSAAAAAGRQTQLLGRSEPVQEFQGSVLSYRLAEPQTVGGSGHQPDFSIDEEQEQAEASASWFDAPAGSQSNMFQPEDAGNEPFDPFAGTSLTFSSDI